VTVGGAGRPGNNSRVHICQNLSDSSQSDKLLRNSVRPYSCRKYGSATQYLSVPKRSPKLPTRPVSHPLVSHCWIRPSLLHHYSNITPPQSPMVCRAGPDGRGCDSLSSRHSLGESSWSRSQYYKCSSHIALPSRLVTFFMALDAMVVPFGFSLGRIKFRSYVIPRLIQSVCR
jgi:hypothetical protein